MPPRDRHGKTAEDYRTALIAERDAISPRSRNQRGLNPLLFVWLLVPLAALWLNLPWLRQHVMPNGTNTPQVIHEPSRASAREQRLPGPLQAAPAQPETFALPRPLDECMRGGTMVDEEVLRCRYGELPRSSSEQDKPRGMVSDEYLAHFKATTAATSRREKQEAQTESETHFISGWDGHSTYRAEWSVGDNRIDYGSVCSNYRKGSIEYRECRKGAKQWFKQQCARYRSSGSALKERYCSAASGFSPMG